MTLSKNMRMLELINYRLKLTLQDGRIFIGQMIAFDRHMNLVMADCEEYRYSKPKKGAEPVEEKRSLGLIVLRGNTIVSVSIEAKPPVGDSMNRKAAAMPQMMQNMPGMSRPGGRGIPPNMPPPPMIPSLSGPVPGFPGPMGPGGPGMPPPPGMAGAPPSFRPPPGMMPPPGPNGPQ